MPPRTGLAPSSIELPPALLRAEILAPSFDVEKRTFEVALYTGSTVQRYSWLRGETYELVLEVTPEACDLTRLNSGHAPFLLDHNPYDVANNGLGVFEAAWIKGGKLFGRVRASGREMFAGILADIRDGILGNVSVGTDILESVWTEKAEKKLRRMTAKKWAPFEGSLVALGADPNATVLSLEREPRTHRTTVCLLLPPSDHMDETLSTETNPAAQPAAISPATSSPAPAAVALSEKERQEVAKLERQRASAIRRIGVTLRSTSTEVEALVESGATLDQARAKLLELAATADDKTAGNSRVEVLRDRADGQREAIQDYVMHRVDPTRYPLANERARQYMGSNLVDLARVCLDTAGKTHRGQSRERVIELALSTSDFPLIVSNIADKELRRTFDLYGSKWRRIVRIRNVSDYKLVSSISAGDAPKLLEVKEGEEYKRATLTESGETAKLRKFGRILPFTRELMVNDDLGAMQEMAQGLGGSCAAHYADLAFAVLTANANLSDGVALFHATHGNLGVKKLTIAGAKEMRNAMGLQTGPNGQILNVSPRLNVVPQNLESESLQLFALEIVPSQISNGNPYRATCETIVEPRLDGTSTAVWYGLADPALMAAIVMLVMEGSGGAPVFEQRVGFDVDGVEIKVRCDAHAFAVEHRAAFKSAGTTD